MIGNILSDSESLCLVFSIKYFKTDKQQTLISLVRLEKGIILARLF